VTCLAGAAGILAGCAGPGYYTQAVAGHLQLMRQRRPVGEVIEDPATDAQQRQRLEEAVAIRRFAIDELGLPDTDSYQNYVATGREAVSWNVVAAPEFSLDPLRWCFPVAGCVPYRGYFHEDDAQRFATRMEKRGLDVSLSPVTAYSTLGWFADPLLDTMMSYDRVRLAAVMIHEMAHQQLYVKSDTAFSESYADFVETAGVALWLQAEGSVQESSDWQESLRAAEQVDALLRQTRSELETLYGTGAEESARRSSKTQIIEAAGRSYRELVQTQWQGRDRYSSWFDGGLNNARLALLDSYRGGNCAFAALYREAGQDMRRFHALARQRAGLPRDQRQAWLQQPCAAVASRNDL